MTTFRKYEAVDTPLPTTTESYREGLIDGLQAAIDTMRQVPNQDAVLLMAIRMLTIQLEMAKEVHEKAARTGEPVVSRQAMGEEVQNFHIFIDLDEG